VERLGVFLDGHAADRVAACAGPDRGTLVDKALTGMYRAELDGQRPEPGDVLELFERAVEPTIAAEKAGVTFTAEEALASVRDVGRRGVQLYIQQLKPYLGRVHAAARGQHPPDCRWTIQGIMDPEAERVDRLAVCTTSGEVLGRVAVVMAQTICALYDALGPESPWPMSEPGNWKCSQRWCHVWADCPGGAGLQRGARAAARATRRGGARRGRGDKPGESPARPSRPA